MKFFKSRFLSGILMAGSIVFACAVGAIASEAPPISAGELSLAMAKHRANITGVSYKNGVYQIFSTRAQGENVESNLSGYYDDSSMALPLKSMPKALGAAAGYVRVKTNLSDGGLMGVTEFTGRADVVCRAYIDGTDGGVYLHPARPDGFTAIRPVKVNLSGYQYTNRRITLHAEDWNDDGYADYIVTVLGNAAVSNYSVVCAYVDGKELWDAATGAAAAPQIAPRAVCGNIGLGTESNPDRLANVDFATAAANLRSIRHKAFIFYYIPPRMSADPHKEGSELHAFTIKADKNLVAFEEIPIERSPIKPYDPIIIDPIVGVDNDGRINVTGGGDDVILYPGGGFEEPYSAYWSQDSSGRFVCQNGFSVISTPVRHLSTFVDSVTGKTLMVRVSERWGGDYFSGYSIEAFNKTDLIRWSRNSRGIHCTFGHFIPYPDTLTEVPSPQLACVGIDNSSFVNWIIYNDALTSAGSGKASYLKDAPLPVLTAADLDSESLLLGDPIGLQVTGAVTPIMVLQAPPRHWDIVSLDVPPTGIQPDENGNIQADAFGRLLGYQTEFIQQDQKRILSSTTTTSQWKAGVDVSVGIKMTGPLKGSEMSVGGNYAHEQTQEMSETHTHESKMTLKADAGSDDYLYFNKIDYTIWRYPVLAPRKVALGETDSGDATLKGRSFMQFIIPSSASSTLLPSKGRDLDWYEPDHDNLNLFTYPKDATKAVAYSAWDGLDPVLLARASGTNIGGVDASSAAVEITDATAKKDLISKKDTLGEKYESNLSIPTPVLLLNVTAHTSIHNDNMWAKDSLTETNASNMTGITINWPGTGGRSVYPADYNPAYPPDEQGFKTDILLFSKPSGAVNVTYGVSQLRRMDGTATNTRIWGVGSPYLQRPDPGLFLPFRFEEVSGKKSTAKGAYRMRRTMFNPYIVHNVVEVGAPTTVTFRVINYSFVATKPVPYEVFFQLTGSSHEEPDLAKATTPVTSGTVQSIPGRDSAFGADNWRDVGFTWNVPSEEGSGYLHFVLHPEKPELNVDNNYGFTPVGFFKPDHIPVQSDGTVAKALSVSETHDLRIDDVIARDGNGTKLDPNALPDDEPFEIECVVALDAQDNASVGGLPSIYLNLFVNGDSLVAAKHATYMKNDTEHRFMIQYDPRMHRDLVKLETLKLSAHGYHFPDGVDRDSANNAVMMRFAGGSEEKSGGGGGGGCSSTASGGALWTFVAAVLFFTAREKKNWGLGR